jgi:hypothetical protein
VRTDAAPGAERRAAAARTAADELSAALEREGFAGHDPWDGLLSPALAALARGRAGRLLAVNALKRSPLDLRRPLGVPRRRFAKALALLASAYARLEPDGGRARELAVELAALGIRYGDGVGYGYEFDVETRWGSYPAGTPNAVVTAFAGHAFLDAGDFEPRVEEVLAFARSSLLRERDGERFYAYHPGTEVAIHNASLLVAGLAARAGAGDERDADAVAFTLARQREDGSWPYGEEPRLGWVDGYHSAYVLDALRLWAATGREPAVDDALARGLDFFLARLVDPDGAPRATAASRYPLDTHAAATAISTLTRLGDERAASTAGRVLDWTLAHMRRADGRFAYRRGRLLRNSVPYVRWSDAHMLLALAVYLEAADA